MTAAFPMTIQEMIFWNWECSVLNMVDRNLLTRISAILQGIYSHHVPRNWWTDFSSLSDLITLLSTGTLLPIPQGFSIPQLKHGGSNIFEYQHSDNK